MQFNKCRGKEIFELYVYNMNELNIILFNYAILRFTLLFDNIHLHKIVVVVVDGIVPDDVSIKQEIHFHQ